jgi:hypothetical protein
MTKEMTMKKMIFLTALTLALTSSTINAQMMSDDPDKMHDSNQQRQAAPDSRQNYPYMMYPDMMGNYGYGMEPGMMGGYGYGMGSGMMGDHGYGMGPGMMGGYGYGMGPGMMGGHGYGMGPGMMGGHGYGMGPGMMHNYGYGRGSGMYGGCGYGPWTKGDCYGRDNAPGYQSPEQYQKFMEETKILRKKLHDLRFEYAEVLRDPKSTGEDRKNLEKEISDLQQKIQEKVVR